MGQQNVTIFLTDKEYAELDRIIKGTDNSELKEFKWELHWDFGSHLYLAEISEIKALIVIITLERKAPLSFLKRRLEELGRLQGIDFKNRIAIYQRYTIGCS